MNQNYMFPTSGNTGIENTSPHSNLRIVARSVFIGVPVNADSHDQLYSFNRNLRIGTIAAAIVDWGTPRL